MTLRGAAALLMGAVALAGGAIAGPERGAAVDEPSAPALSTGAAMAALGRRLFYDGDLSIDGSMACSTCHGQRHGFAESNRAHPGVTDEPGRRNVQTLANVGRRKSLTWGDATLRTLEAQALVPMFGEGPVEMGMKGQEAELARRLGTNACYVRLFHVAFAEAGGRIDVDTVTRALGAFQRTLVSDDAPADPRDRGLGEVTGRSGDDGRFRTPSLRNVAVSAPYFHDGRAPTLADAIRRHGLRVSAPDEGALIAWMEAMTDRTFIENPGFAYPDGPCEVE